MKLLSGIMFEGESVRRTSCVAILFGLIMILQTHAQTTNKVEVLGSIAASQAAEGLGFNLNPANEWEFQEAAAAGAATVRFQCSWVSVETQSPPPQNTNEATKYVLPEDCRAGLGFAKKYSMRPTVIAAYGSPFHEIVQVSLSAVAHPGATTLNVQFASGIGGSTLSKIAFPYDTILSASGSQITRVHSYAGGLITGVRLTDASHAILTLASAITSELTPGPGQLLTINEYLYPPAATFSPTDPSNVAFAKYAEFLASSIANEGIKGEVEIWNEPPWPDDPWDERANFYDVFPGSATTIPQPFLPNFGFVAAIQAQASPAAGVTYVWGGTEKSGASSLFNWMQFNTGERLSEPVQIVTTESMHPYGNTPEDSLWTESCLSSTILPYPSPPTAFYPCNLFGLPGGNASLGEQLSLVQTSLNSSWGVHREITETGFGNAYGDANHKARFLLRQFLGYQAQGVTPIEFYRLWDQSTEGMGFVTRTSTSSVTTPYLAYTAISGLMADISTIKGAPVSGLLSAMLPSVQSYSGTYPLDTVALVGTAAGSRANSILFTLWQRSYGEHWGVMASPPAGSVVLKIPAGMTASHVTNLTTRASVAYRSSGQSLTLAVADDPVEVMFSPATVTRISIASSSTHVPAGATDTLSCTATLYDGTQTACNSPVFDSSNASVAEVSGDQADAKNIGATTLTAHIGSLTSSTLLTVDPIVPTVLFNAIANQVAGGPAFKVSVISPSLGAMAYSIVSGPATNAGQLIKTSGAGAVVLKVIQAAYGNYSAAQAQTSFVVKPPSTQVTLSLPVAVVSTTLALPGAGITILKVGNNWPTGTVEILDNGKSISSYPLTAESHGHLGGVTINPMPIGSHAVSAYYTGDENYSAGASLGIPVSVVPYQSAILGSCTNTKLTLGQSLSCTITGTEGPTALTGSVTYTVNGASFTSPLVSGKATILVPHLPKGSGTLVVKYLQQHANPACPYAINLAYTVN